MRTVDLPHAAIPLESDDDIAPAVLDTIGSASLVLLGEASHGTHEFYLARAAITKRLIEDFGFTAVCVEGDWPDTYRVNRYVRGAGDDADARAALSGFERFPAWMWRNADVADFVEWLRGHNTALADDGRRAAGFYGLDLYSMYASIDAVLQYLDRVDPQAAERARRRYECLEPFEQHPERYGYAAKMGLEESCRNDVLAQLRELQQQAARYANLDGQVAEDRYFYAEQNARIVANAERYYAAMLDDGASTWNLRDEHMVDTLERLLAHLGRDAAPVKAVVWAHNSHVGDARATAMSQWGETNIGALLKERYGDADFAIGFTTDRGTVTAASDWHGAEECKTVLASRGDSYEHLLHELCGSLGAQRLCLPLRPFRPLLHGLPARALERAIGVIYRPQTELQSHYFEADLMRQFDAVVHVDATSAVQPLAPSERWQGGEPPETYPSGD